MLPVTVGTGKLIAANSGLWSAAVVSQIALVSLAGLMVTVWGMAPAFYFNAATFAASAPVLGQPCSWCWPNGTCTPGLAGSGCCWVRSPWEHWARCSSPG